MENCALRSSACRRRSAWSSSDDVVGARFADRRRSLSWALNEGLNRTPTCPRPITNSPIDARCTTIDGTMCMRLTWIVSITALTTLVMRARVRPPPARWLTTVNASPEITLDPRMGLTWAVKPNRLKNAGSGKKHGLPCWSSVSVPNRSRRVPLPLARFAAMLRHTAFQMVTSWLIDISSRNDELWTFSRKIMDGSCTCST